MKALALPLVALALLAGCDSPGQDADEAAPPAQAGTASADPSAAPTPTPVATEIPAAFHGRWGLKPEDCERRSPDPEGLLTISADTLDFYESTAKLGTIEQAADTRLRATFDFTGEGESWSSQVALDLENGGNTLVRREFGADAALGPFRYTRCTQE